jgi:hypothetical protein
MKIVDKIYGKFEIKDSLACELINSYSVQRLKDIFMSGLPQKYWHFPVCSRYEHSLGVFLFLKKLGANNEEQIAGLLHDVSHTAFSHIIDWVLGDPKKEDYQDKNHRAFLEASDVNPILKKYNFDFKKIADLESFKILDSPIPHLCVDRFDYTIREIYYAQPKINLEEIVNSIKIHEGKMVFISQDHAEIFSRCYLKRQKEHWAADISKAKYYLASDMLKKGIVAKIISITDLTNTDEFVLDILNNSKNPQILSLLEALTKPLQIVEDNSPQAISLEKKERYVDPLVLVSNKPTRLSSLSSNYKSHLNKELAELKKIKRVKIIY